MELGESRNTNLVLRLIGHQRNEVEKFVLQKEQESFYSFTTLEQVSAVFQEKTNQFLQNLSEEELLDLRSYTGYNFKQINAILRNNWTYEQHGLLNEDVQKKYKQLSQHIGHILEKSPSLALNFTTYRGVGISAFANYGITTLSELEYMKGKYMYEEGFASTSILNHTSYFNQHLETGLEYNIQIQYLISKECNEGALLSNFDMSYSPSQNEYLLNHGSLTKIVDVNIDHEKNQAILVGILIPKKVWDLSVKLQEENVSSNKII